MFSSDDASRKIKEDKYKILRMSLILENNPLDIEAINDFETSAREIDAMNQEIYNEGLVSKYYDTLSLEEEKSRLEELITFVSNRLVQRDALKEDYFNVTGRSLTDLDSIRDENKLEEYKDRLKYIDKYLDNTSNIEKAIADIETYQSDLDKAYEDKANSEENNVKLEKDLLELFKKSVSDEDVILGNEEEINKELDNVNPLILESKKSLDIFNKSFTSLKKAGISGREEKEYYSYVINARSDYYDKMERYFLLSLYRLIYSTKSEFEDIFNKRNKIREILNDRKSLRANLEVSEEDKLNELYTLLDKQYEEIKIQKDNISNISVLKDKIATRERELDNYKDDNQRVEILSLLKEFSLIEDENLEEDEPFELEIDKDEDIEVYDYEELLEEVKEEEVVVLDNEVVEVRDCTSLDIVSVREKAKGVMLRVGKMLSPDTQAKEEIKEDIEVLDLDKNIDNKVVEFSLPDTNNIDIDYNVNNNVNVDSQEEELELPKFDDLPTVSSLTAQGSINDTSNSVVNNNVETSFWGNSTNDFEFPDINNWGGN